MGAIFVSFQKKIKKINIFKRKRKSQCNFNFLKKNHIL